MAEQETFSEVSVKAFEAIRKNGGSVEVQSGQERVSFPEGTTRESASVDGWRTNESSLHWYTLPDGTVLRYSTDWEDQKLIVRSYPQKQS